MQIERSETKKPRKSIFLRIFKAIPAKYIILTLLVAAISIICTVGITSGFFSDGTTLKLNFENIGELATQAAYCTVLDSIDNPRTFFNTDIPIPFTRSRLIYSQQYIIKAGFDFKDITPEVNETTISIHLPPVRILSQSTVPNSLKVYIEEDNIFSPITLKEQVDSEQARIDEAIQDAINNGLFENAITNAKDILTGFIKQTYPPDQYEIKFFDKESGEEL